MASNLFICWNSKQKKLFMMLCKLLLLLMKKIGKKRKRILQSQREITRYNESHMDCIVYCNLVLECEWKNAAFCYQKKNLHFSPRNSSKCNLHSYGKVCTCVCAFIIKKYSTIIRITSLYHRFLAASQHYKCVRTLEHGNRQFNIKRKMKPARLKIGRKRNKSSHTNTHKIKAPQHRRAFTDLRALKT